ncbi:hypothetical protein DFR50_13522 [Roseiarcus fermentans]|uniref:Uncharacterized protein n=1 Tax=Roseiarcus fermentans TaxID=1473586 RepID=A0A366ES32_9HYPH|nr:hypothetical protein DFR50_13522 [Roseiarcus fermentans]
MLDDPPADAVASGACIDQDRTDKRALTAKLQSAIPDDAIALGEGVEGQALGIEVIIQETRGAQGSAQGSQLAARDRRGVKVIADTIRRRRRRAPHFPQQVGAQQAPTVSAVLGPGFFARTNALMNLPSTVGAMASTSTPLPDRNSRASSTL